MKRPIEINERLLKAYFTYVQCRLADIRDGYKELAKQEEHFRGELWYIKCELERIRRENADEV